MSEWVPKRPPGAQQRLLADRAGRLVAPSNNFITFHNFSKLHQTPNRVSIHFRTLSGQFI